MKVGRGLASGDAHLHVIGLGHGLWQRRFGSDSSSAGKTITLSGRPFTVVGVAPLLAQANQRIHKDLSVSSLFD